MPGELSVPLYKYVSSVTNVRICEVFGNIVDVFVNVAKSIFDISLTPTPVLSIKNKQEPFETIARPPTPPVVNDSILVNVFKSTLTTLPGEMFKPQYK